MAKAKFSRILPTQNPNKIRLEVKQEVVMPGANLLSILNKSDIRFTGSKPLVTWITGEVKDILTVYPKLKSFVEQCVSAKEIVNITTDVFTDYDGKIFNLQINEGHIASVWQSENLEKAAKRAGQDGDFIVSEDNFLIFRSISVIEGLAKHNIVQNTSRVSDPNEAYYFLKTSSGELVTMQGEHEFQEEEISYQEEPLPDEVEA